MGIPTKSLLFEHLADFLSVEDYLKLGQVSKGLRKTVKPLIELRRHCNVVSVAPNLEITSLISPRCDHHLRRILSKKTDIPFPIKSVTLHDWRYANLANVLVLDHESDISSSQDNLVIAKTVFESSNLDRIIFLNQDFTGNHGYEQLFSNYIPGLSVNQVILQDCVMDHKAVVNFGNFLESLNNLEMLILENLKTTHASIQYMVNSLKYTRSLKTLRITQKDIPRMKILDLNILEDLRLVALDNEFLAYSRGFESSLQRSSKLKRLDISLNLVSESKFAKSLSKLTELQDLTLRMNNKIRNSNILNVISQLSNLNKLSLYDFVDLRDSEALILSGSETLKSLEIVQMDTSSIKIILKYFLQGGFPSVSSLSLKRYVSKVDQDDHEFITLLYQVIPRLKSFHASGFELSPWKLSDVVGLLSDFSMTDIAWDYDTLGWNKFGFAISKSKTLKNVVIKFLDNDSFYFSRISDLSTRDYLQTYLRACVEGICRIFTAFWEALIQKFLV